MLNIDAYTLKYPLDEPISISFHTFHSEETLILRLYNSQHEGWGEAAPFKPITGDSLQDVIDQVKRLGSVDIDPENHSVQDLHKVLDEQITSQTLKAAIDFAWHDLQGKKQDMPVYKLYGSEAHTVDNSVTVFVHEDPQDTAKAAGKVFTEYSDLKILKIKLAGNKDDVHVAKEIARVAPKNMKYIVDANQGFKDPDQAVDILHKVIDELGDLVLVEEPCPKHDLEKLRYVTNNIRGTMIFADESAATIDDAKKVIAAQAAHGINIKLEKAGGIWPGKVIAEMCQTANLKAMVGCMMERALGISAGVHFAVTTSAVILTDLDGDLGPNYTTDTIVPFENGQRIPTNESGLGISINFDKIEESQKKGYVEFKKITQ